MDINVGLLQWFIHILIKKTSDSGIKNESISNKEVAEELHKPIIRNFKKGEVDSLFIGNIRGGDMQLICKFKKSFPFSLCVIDIYGKYAWVISWKYKKGIAITNTF